LSDAIADAYALLFETKSAAACDADHVYKSFRATFDTPDGQRVLAWICREAGLMIGLNEGMAPEEIRQDYAGRRHMVQWILKHSAIPPAKVERQDPVSPLDRN
jgi:hypothetical protein